MKSVEKQIPKEKERSEVLSKKAQKYSAAVSRIVTKKDYEKHESALAVANDEKYQSKIQSKIEHLKGAKHVLLIGIGGSSLGVEAVYSALALRTSPKLYVYDSIDEDALKDIETITKKIDQDSDLAVVVVSKSGTTTETLTNAVSIIEQLEDQYGETIRDRIVFIGTEGTPFLKTGKKKKVTCVTIPESIGGRYSVFTAVGVVPLTLLSVDVVSFLEGAHEAISPKYRKEVVRHAVILAELAEQGTHTVNFFTFNKRLKTLGLWFRQLLAESIGKQMTTEGVTFSHQLLPTATSAVDLHSMAQLYLGGYKGLFTHFVSADTTNNHHALTDHWLLDLNKNLEGHTPKEIKEAIQTAVLKAYDEQKLPYRLTTLPKVSAHEMGLLMGSLMFETMCLCDLFDVDAFNQPNVESYKTFTRELLRK